MVRMSLFHFLPFIFSFFKFILFTYTSVAKVLRDVDAIVVAQYDLTENDVDPKYFDEPTLPVLRLYLKGSKDKPITYKGKNFLFLCMYLFPVLNIVFVFCRAIDGTVYALFPQ